MILALLHGDGLGYGAAAVLLRAACYAGSLGGAGLTFFSLLFGARQEASDAARLRRWAAGAALLALAACVGGMTAHVGVLTMGQDLLDAEAWNVVLASPAGWSYGVGAVGLSLVASLGLGPRWAAAAAVGGLLVCVSYAMLGHTTSLSPRPVAAGLLVLHLAAAAFWIGSLPPLAWAARRAGPGAARVVEGWTRVAMLAVPALVTAGLLLALWVLGGVQALIASYYGWALLGKLSLVAILLVFAAWHRYRLTPALAAHTPGAGVRLSRSIAAEAAVALLVLYAAAEMVSTSPEGAAHGMH